MHCKMGRIQKRSNSSEGGYIKEINKEKG
jgi:hypothetical protein